MKPSSGKLLHWVTKFAITTKPRIPAKATQIKLTMNSAAIWKSSANSLKYKQYPCKAVRCQNSITGISGKNTITASWASLPNPILISTSTNFSTSPTPVADGMATCKTYATKPPLPTLLPTRSS